ncbi:MAG: TIGR01459 family HAD-type hydrolase [Pseudomonadota bacterium]
MAHFQEIEGLSEIQGSYEAILCDVWGVIHNGRQAFEAACDALVEFRNRGKAVVLITNAPVPKSQVIRYFEPLGVPETAYDDCVSSGDATRAVLRRFEGQRVWVMGIDFGFVGDRALWEGLDLTLVDGPDAQAFLCMGLDDSENDDPEDYRDRLKMGVDAGLSMICANPDIQVRVGNKLVWCAGALARIYEALGGTVQYPGKPYGAIYALAREKLTEMGVSSFDRGILAIGDGPVTDILGANREGIDSLYVGSGLAADSEADFTTDTAKRLADAGVTATYAMPSLRW